MSSLSKASLSIPNIRKCYTEDIIINMFWKHGIGNIYRVDFESDDSVNVYIYEAYDWETSVIKSLEETGEYVLHFTTFEGSAETWTMHVNPNPIPMATSNKNVHQLEYENALLKARIEELENAK